MLSACLLHVGLDERKGLGADEQQSAFYSKIPISAEQRAGEMIRREREEGGLKPGWFNLLSAFRGRCEEVRRRLQAL